MATAEAGVPLGWKTDLRPGWVDSRWQLFAVWAQETQCQALRLLVVSFGWKPVHHSLSSASDLDLTFGNCSRNKFSLVLANELM